MKVYKAIIIDDNPSARSALRNLLNEFCKDIEVLGEGNGLAQGHQLIEDVHPDIVFLDVELDEKSGFDLLAQRPNRTFVTIMVTGHDHYAVNAFRTNAEQFVTKPIDPDDLVRAISAVKGQIKSGVKSKSKQRLNIPLTNGQRVLELANIVYIRAEGSYSNIQLQSKERIIASQNLSELERQLPAESFFRCHRSFIVNLDHVKLLTKSGEWVLEMSTGAEVDVSRSKHEALLKLL